MSLTFMPYLQICLCRRGCGKPVSDRKYSPQCPLALTTMETGMPGYSDPGFDTLALHAGAQPDPATGARATPIHLTTSFVFESSDHAASLFNLERPGHVYSRISNPTRSEEHTSELQSQSNLVCRLLLEKKK